MDRGQKKAIADPEQLEPTWILLSKIYTVTVKEERLIDGAVTDAYCSDARVM